MKPIQVPFLDLRREYSRIDDQINKAIERVFDRGRFILDEEVKAFEAEFAEYVGARYGVGVSSGTAALTIALQSAGVGEGDEVITAANTAIPTVNAILRAHAKPVLVDVREEDCTIDVFELKKAITSRTKAIIPVHLYGYPCDMPQIIKLANEAGIRVVEDCAQAHGAAIGGKKVGSYGDIGCFSFYPTKNLGAYGDGGMLITDSNELAQRARMIRHHGQSSRNVHEIQGMCARLDELQAAVLRIKLRSLDERNERRREIAKRYMGELQGVQVFEEKSGRESVWHLFVVRTGEREKLMEELSQRGITTAVHYPTPIHLQKAFRDLGWREGDFPVTERLAGEIVSLPVFPELTDHEVSWVIESVNEVLATH
ncbi:MAG: DegT/DnrJ/EryC1/StrS family aminotransferase [Candidatus Glassbacteria bacterium]